jgi:hypothetical protein
LHETISRQTPLRNSPGFDFCKKVATTGVVSIATFMLRNSLVKCGMDSGGIPPQRAYDFSFVRQAEQQLSKQGWKP